VFDEKLKHFQLELGTVVLMFVNINKEERFTKNSDKSLFQIVVELHKINYL